VAGVAGLILAGGIGVRFGGPKAWALLPDGRSFLEACADALRAAGVDPMAATLPPGSDDPGIAGLIGLPLPQAGLDMFGSLRIGVFHLLDVGGWHRLAVLPVDHPLVRPGTVAALAAADTAAVVPRVRGKHGHPVVIGRSTAAAIAGGSVAGPTLREVLRDIGAVEIDVDDPGVIVNCNTPATLARAVNRPT